MTVLKSYDLNGKKLSFANWISNLSPQETPFSSMTGKESINQTLFQWQTDTLAAAGKNAQKEGAEAVEGHMATTHVKQNLTQILRKTVKVSDTANALANYGRGKELQYQMEKAGKELKRDLEYAFLHNVNSQEEHISGATIVPRKTAGFEGLVAARYMPDPDTGAVVHKDVQTGQTLTEAKLFDLTYNLYLAGSDADVIMFHPKHASFFSSLQEKSTGGSRVRMFEDTPRFSVYVNTVVDPLGQEYKLIPNRWMPEDKIFFFNPKDWTQMILRSPQRTKLAKDGSYEKWMIEMEVGLRHRNPYASGILDIDHTDDPAGNDQWSTKKVVATASDSTTEAETDITKGLNMSVKKGKEIKFKVKTKIEGTSDSEWGIKLPTNPTSYYRPTKQDRFVLVQNGHEVGHWTLTDSDIGSWTAEAGRAPTQPAQDRELFYTSSADVKHNGEYRVELRSQMYNWQVVSHTDSVNIFVK